MGKVWFTLFSFSSFSYGVEINYGDYVLNREQNELKAQLILHDELSFMLDDIASSSAVAVNKPPLKYVQYY